MKGFLAYVTAILLTFLPPRYRKDLLLAPEAAVGGVLQFFVALGTLLGRFYIFFQRYAGLTAAPAPNSFEYQSVIADNFGGGVFMAAEFFMSFVNSLLFYFVFESIIRTLAALISGQVVGTLPLYAVSAIHKLVDKAAYRRAVGPLVVDEIVRGGSKQGYDLKVYSCRPKLHWSSYMTIEFEDQFYQMFKEEPGDGPRRFIYYLRKNPTGRLVVTIDHYKVDDVLKPPPPEESGWQQVWDQAVARLDRVPVVPDEVIRGTKRATYALKVYSCRPKPDWNSYVTIQFEGQFYEMFKQEAGPKPRPFVYYLRKNPKGKPTVVIRLYEQ